MCLCANGGHGLGGHGSGRVECNNGTQYSVESTSATRSGHKSANVMYEFRLFNANAAFFWWTRWMVWCVGGVFVGDA